MVLGTVLSEPDWQLRFFDALDEVFGHRPATRPPVIFDTTDDQQSTDSHASNRAVSQPAPPSSASHDVNNPG